MPDKANIENKMSQEKFDNVRQSIQSFGEFSGEELNAITDRLKIMTLRKDDYLISEGHICREFYFINQGSFRHYTISENGVDATINLYIEKEWIFDYKSMMTQKPSENILQAAEESEVFELSANDFHELVKTSNAFFRVGRIFEQAIQNQDYQHTRMSPEEKYTMLLKNKPQIIQRFPLKYIASYLGVTPETLSRVRKKLSS